MQTNQIHIEKRLCIDELKVYFGLLSMCQCVLRYSDTLTLINHVWIMFFVAQGILFDNSSVRLVAWSYQCWRLLRRRYMSCEEE